MSVNQQLILTQDPPRVSRDEMNLAEFPLTILSTRSNPKTKTLEFSDSIKGKSGELINRSWIITGADKFGLPTASDDEVLLGLLKLTVDDGMRSPKIYFTRYEMLKTLRWTTEGRSYSRLQKALDRLSGVRIKATNAFYDNEAKLHSTKNFGILDGYEINDGRDNENKKSFFTWSEVIFKSFQVGFIKKLDLDFYLQLDSAVSKRIYRYLDKHFWYKSRIQSNLFTFAHEKIGISRNYRFVSSIRQQIDPAIEELIKSGFISACEYQGRGSGAEIILYSGKMKPRVLAKNERQSTQNIPENNIQNLSEQSHYSAQESDQSEIYTAVYNKLIGRGIKAQQVAKLLKAKSPPILQRINKIIERYDFLVSSGSTHVSKNPIGFLYRAVENYEQFNLPGESQLPKQNGIASQTKLSFVQPATKAATAREEAKDSLETLKSQYLVERKQAIQRFRSSVEEGMLQKIGTEVRGALAKLQGLISGTRFAEAIEHGVDEKLAKLFAVPDFEEWVKGRKFRT